MEQETQTKTKKVDKVGLIVAELETIQQTVITRAKENSIKDIRVTLELSEMPKTINTSRIKAVNSNYEKAKATVTFYRSYINVFVATTKQLTLGEFNKILSLVAQKGLFLAFNLWVNGTVQQNKNKLFA